MLAEADKPPLSVDYDHLVSAEIPDPENEKLYQTVRMCMMHGPCGRSDPDAPCMKDGVCSKRFSKNFTNETNQVNDGYPVYRRCKNRLDWKCNSKGCTPMQSLCCTLQSVVVS